MDLNSVLSRDRFRLKKLHQRLQASQSTEEQQRLQQQYDQLYQQSAQTYQMRQAKQLNITYPEHLPVSEKREEIKRLIDDHQVVIVAGETGSGKTTQLAKMCLELGRGRAAMIGHTQPRRIAATAVANRVAEELALVHGQEIASQIRFFDNSNEHTLLKVMTDGVLLAEIAHDRFLERYDTLIIDEAHERSLNIDFLLGYIKGLLPKRPDLKVIITSATIDVERFSEYFNQAPAMRVSGRSYDVEILYRDVDREQEDALYASVLSAVEEIQAMEYSGQAKQRLGDVLVFLPGEQDIRHCAMYLRRAQISHCDVLPLYARLPAKEQQKIFNPEKQATRRIVLATNVAETSLTVPGIHYVIDSGLARISRYSHRSKVQRLPIEKISRASANQRAGRCGRLSEGICIRLYDQDDFERREAFTEPEIQRSNLAAVILQMQSLRLGQIDKFPFIQPPDKRLINDGIKQLTELAALNKRKGITGLGRKMSQLPIDPKLARIVLAADRYGVLKEALIVVAALSVQDPREFPTDKKEAAWQKHVRFRHEQSDFLSFLNLWQETEQQRQALSRNQFAKWCRKEFLSPQRLYEWRETHAQLRRIAKNLQLKENQVEADYASLHKALLSGFLLNVGFQHEKRLFTGTRNRVFRIFPGSFLAKKAPKWLVAAELIETSQLFAHTVAMIEPEWLYEVAQHVLKFNYLEPHFSSQEGQVLAWQKASLYGLEISDKKRVSYAQIDAALTREIFIRNGLVEEQMKSQAGFYQHNRQLRREIECLEEKSRRRDLLVSDEAVFAFYQARLPQDILNQQGLESWAKKADAKALYANKAVFLSNNLDNSQAQFPESIEWQDTRYRLRYRFEPGHAEDGVSVEIPVAILNRVPHFLFEWLVPGMLQDKVEALLKTLPKQLRRQLVPIPDTVQAIMPLLEAQDKALHVVIGDILWQEKRIKIPVESWQLEQLSPWYLMNFKVLNERSRMLEQSRDLAYLLQQHSGKARKILAKQTVVKEEVRYYSRWDFDDLPQKHYFQQGKNRVLAYPALQDEGDKVSIQLFDYPSVQQAKHKRGLLRLAMLSLPQQSKYLRKELLKGNTLQLKMGGFFDKTALIEDAVSATFMHTFFDQGLLWTKNEFEQRLNENKNQLIAHGLAIEKLLIEIIEQDYLLRQYIQKAETYAIEDAKAQREALLTPHFVSNTPYEHLQHMPRYMKALALRLEKIAMQAPKDKQATAELSILTERMQQLLKQVPQAENLEEIEQYRWLIEEYRVSLFAQQLKTRVPISRKRLDALWHEIEQKVQRDFLS